MSRPPVIADLHLHSRCSDGELSPAEVVDLAAAQGLEAIALTDHDTVGGMEEALAQGRVRNLGVIPGCELTVYEGGTELHMLALFVDISPAADFSKLLEHLRETRRTRAFKSAGQLRAAGVRVDDDDVLEAAAGAQSIGRPHIAKALLKRGQVPSVETAFNTFLAKGKPGYVPKFALNPEDAFRAVHASGGLALLAHPGAMPHDELIAPLFGRGLDGLEVNHPAHSEMNRRFYAGLARRCEKLISGGSDFHGPSVKAGVQIGDAGIDRAALSQLRRAAKAHK